MSFLVFKRISMSYRDVLMGAFSWKDTGLKETTAPSQPLVGFSFLFANTTKMLFEKYLFETLLNELVKTQVKIHQKTSTWQSFKNPLQRNSSGSAGRLFFAPRIQPSWGQVHLGSLNALFNQISFSLKDFLEVPNTVFNQTLYLDLSVNDLTDPFFVSSHKFSRNLDATIRIIDTYFDAMERDPSIQIRADLVYLRASLRTDLVDLRTSVQHLKDWLSFFDRIYSPFSNSHEPV